MSDFDKLFANVCEALRGEQRIAYRALRRRFELSEQGKLRLEVEEPLGYAIRQAAELGVPTSTLDTCCKLIARINHDLQ